MYEHAPSAIKSFLDERIADGKVLDDVLFRQVIDLNEEMLDMDGKVSMKRRTEDGDNVGDVGLA